MVSEGDIAEWHDLSQKNHFEGEVLEIEETETGVRVVFDVETRFDGDDVDLEMITIKSLDDSRLEVL